VKKFVSRSPQVYINNLYIYIILQDVFSDSYSLSSNNGCFITIPHDVCKRCAAILIYILPQFLESINATYRDDVLLWVRCFRYCQLVLLTFFWKLENSEIYCRLVCKRTFITSVTTNCYRKELKNDIPFIP
jgi:hypothetical protein